MVDKAGKLPTEVLEYSYALEFGEALLSLQASRQFHNRRVIPCDNLLSTGCTLVAATQLVKQVGGCSSQNGKHH